jgi:hypothetical protein
LESNLSLKPRETASAKAPGGASSGVYKYVNEQRSAARQRRIKQSQQV